MPHPKGKEFVDFDEDLTLADLNVAYREGFDSVELMKRYFDDWDGTESGQGLEHERCAYSGAAQR